VGKGMMPGPHTAAAVERTMLHVEMRDGSGVLLGLSQERVRHGRFVARLLGQLRWTGGLVASGRLLLLG
jgi:hypothetical protein